MTKLEHKILAKHDKGLDYHMYFLPYTEWKVYRHGSPILHPKFYSKE